MPSSSSGQPACCWPCRWCCCSCNTRKPAPRPPAQAIKAYRRKPDYWLYVAVGVLNAFCGFGILGWLPSYFVRAKGIDFAALGWPLSIVFGAGVVGTLAIAWLGDQLHRRVLLASIGFAAAQLALVFAIPAQRPGSRWSRCSRWPCSARARSRPRNMQRSRNWPATSDVGAATGTYNGTSLIIGGVVGSMVPGRHRVGHRQLRPGPVGHCRGRARRIGAGRRGWRSG